MSKREFTIADEYHYNHSNPVRWILSHLLRYKQFVIGFILLSLTTSVLYATIKTSIGFAFNAVQQGEIGMLIGVARSLLILVLLASLARVGAGLTSAILAVRFARDARDELYLGLLGKSQTFHNRQRVGDIMARASSDVEQLSNMVVPGLYIVFESFGGLLIAFVFIGVLDLQLLLAPLLYMLYFLPALHYYQRQLSSVTEQMRQQFGETNGVLNEAVMGIEVIKATSQEEHEQKRFMQRAIRYRDFFVKNSLIEGRYIPMLVVGIFLILAFLHGLYLFSQHYITLGTLIAFMVLVNELRTVTVQSSFSFSAIQVGVASTNRILKIMQEETELDENEHGHYASIQGDIVFENVSFSYGTTPILKNISFHAKAGQTIAIVGQTGSGKSTLTKLINRIYDVDEGRILIDGIDVRSWNLGNLRSQISTIEQDIFLFSRSIAENIAFGLGQGADQVAIVRAAKDAQADDFIMGFKQGYDTLVGEMGVTLSGGQRQRVAIARALLTDPRILILDDATSAVDSATEDEIQKSIRNVLEGRTTFLITHRISQIRWADIILVLQEGVLIAQGTHDELLRQSETYRRILSHYVATAPTSYSGE